MSEPADYRFEAELWRWKPESSWMFVALPQEISDDIAARFEGIAVGFGSIRVEVAVGGSQWATSLFPDAARATYVLPIKAGVRRAEGVDDGDMLSVGLHIGDVPPAAARGSRRGG